MKKSVLLLFTLLGFAQTSKTQTTFDKRYNSNDGYCNSIIATLDSRFMVSGTDGAFPNGKFCLFKMDSLGNSVWKKKYDFGANAYHSYVKQAPDSSYYVYGQVGGGATDVGGVVKVDKNGNFIWGKRFTGVNDQSIRGGLFVENGNFLLGHGIGNGYGLSKISPAGNIIWSKNNTSNTNNSTNEIISTSDGNYVLVGSVYTGSTYKAHVTKIDTSGSVIWSKQFTDISLITTTDICQTTDGGYAICLSGNCMQVIVKLDASGNMLWNIFSPASGCSDLTLDLAALPSNKILIMGARMISGFRELRLFELDGNGTTYSENKINSATAVYQEDNNIVTNNDGSLPSGPIMLAFSSTNGAAGYNVRRLKSNYTGCNVVSQPSQTTTTYSGITQQIGSSISTTTLTTIAMSSPTVTTPTLSATSYCSVSPLSVTSTQTNVLCNGACTGTATAVPSGGQAPYTYSWTGGGSGGTKTAMCAGTYTCTVTDALSATATVVVTITQPALIALSTNATTPTLCSGNCTNLNATSSGGTGSHTYGWMPGSLTGATVNVCPTSTTTYTCTVTDGNSCTKTSTVTVTVNTIPATPGTISGIATICSGTTNTYSITAVSGATSYTWTLPGGWTGTSTTNSINATASATSGNITVTANNSCGSSSVQTKAITVTSIPATPGSISGTATICSGTTNTYSITAVAGATSYTWSLPGGWIGTSTTTSINATASATSGNITVTANNACGNSSAQTLSVTVNTIPATPGTISGLASMCIGTGAQTYSITPVGGATSYTWTLPGGWSGASTTNSISATPGATGGNITITANNSCGNSSPQTLVVTVNPLPTVTYSQSPSLVCVNATSVALGNASPSGGTYSGTAVTGSTFNASTAGTGTFTITYTYTDANSCVNSDTSNIVVSACTGIEQATSDESLLIYPNPAFNSITITGNKLKGANISIVNMLGETVYATNAASEKTEINISELKNGIYFIHLISENKTTVRKIIKE